jgi:hypothetical protein
MPANIGKHGFLKNRIKQSQITISSSFLSYNVESHPPLLKLWTTIGLIISGVDENKHNL